jgi:hypothetical protein
LNLPSAPLLAAPGGFQGVQFALNVGFSPVLCWSACGLTRSSIPMSTAFYKQFKRVGIIPAKMQDFFPAIDGK